MTVSDADWGAVRVPNGRVGGAEELDAEVCGEFRGRARGREQVPQRQDEES